MTDHKIIAVLTDCGDTLIDEATEEKSPGSEVTLRAELIPGAAELLAEIKRRGYLLGLVADGPEATFRNILAQHQLSHLFDTFAISERVGCSKPCPSIYLHALEELDIVPQDYGRVVMVGNYLERDVKGANALGIVSVWLDWAPRRPKMWVDDSEEPRFVIKRPLELLDVLDSLEKELV